MLGYFSRGYVSKTVVLMTSLLVNLAGCQQSAPTTLALHLGSMDKCQQYQGLPPHFPQETTHHQTTAGMAFIKAGSLQIGTSKGYKDELPLSSGKPIDIPAFWIDQTEVTNAQFAQFVKATGYVTDAEKQGGGAVFIAPKPDEAIFENSWWHYVKGANWQHPFGPDSNIVGKGHEPVVLVTQNDAEHYAQWLGHDLPTEAQWEFAAKGRQEDESLNHAPHDQHGAPTANYWQGNFPTNNLKTDHFEGVAPVGCFAADQNGLYDMIGNVWEWTKDAYSGSHDEHQQEHGGNPALTRTQQFASSKAVIKGGSYLCAANYCVRYRAAARYPQEIDLPTTHVGFRTVLNL